MVIVVTGNLIGDLFQFVCRVFHGKTQARCLYHCTVVGAVSHCNCVVMIDLQYVGKMQQSVALPRCRRDDLQIIFV